MLSRLLKITGLFCKRAPQKGLYSAKKTNNLKKPTNRSHPIGIFWLTFHTSVASQKSPYGVALTSRLLTIIGLFCKRALQKRRYSAKEPYNFKELTNQSHSIPCAACIDLFAGFVYVRTDFIAVYMGLVCIRISIFHWGFTRQSQAKAALPHILVFFAVIIGLFCVCIGLFWLIRLTRFSHVSPEQKQLYHVLPRPSSA